MAFTNGQTVQAADLNNLSVTSLTTSGTATVGGALSVTGTASITGNTAITGSLTVGGVAISASVGRNVSCGRLSLTSGTPVTTTDVTAATTIYFALYGGNQIALYSGSEWVLFVLTELSIAIPGAANQMYDVFVNYNAGTPALAVTAWTNDTTRATALTKQDGVLVKTGSTGQRYVGTFRTTAVAGQTEDSYANRLVFNYYNRVDRLGRVLEATDTWNYTTDTWRQANGAAGNQIGYVVGVVEDVVSARVTHLASNGGAATVYAGIGQSSTTAPIALSIGMTQGIGGTVNQIEARYEGYPTLGYQTWVWLERSQASGVTAWYGDNGGAVMQSGITLKCRG